MSFEEIITKMENAEDYMDLYDAASYIVDDNLRVSVEQLIEDCEISGSSVEEAYSIVTSDLLDMRINELNESVEINKEEQVHSSIQDYINDLENASNDKDLLNILDDMEQNKNLDTERVLNIRQLFRNNRFMPLNSKVDTLVRYINTFDTKQESLTEATVISQNKHNKDDKDDKDEDEIDNDNKETSEETSRDDDNSDTILEALNDRVGQQFSVGELNKLLQNLLGQPNKLFLLTSDLSSMDLDRTQHIDIEDDSITYIISFDIIDMENGIIELTNARIESGE